MKLKFRILAVIAVAAMAVANVGCDSDEPPVNDPETPETPVTPDEPEEPEVPAEPLTDEIRPVLTDGKKWVCQKIWHHTAIEKTDDIYTTYVDEEIEVDGVSAKTIKCTENEYYYEVLREENGMVHRRWEFVIDYNSMKSKYEFMYAYDINPLECKTIIDALSQTITIQSKGTIVLCGKTRRAAMVKFDRRSDGVLYDYWVEGIGALFGLEPYYNTDQPSTWLYNWKPMYEKLLECYDGEEKIYDYTAFSPDKYTPEVVFEELDANTLEIIQKMIDGSIAKK